MKNNLRIRLHRLTTREQFCTTLAALLAMNQRLKAHGLLRDALAKRSITGMLCSELFLHLSLLLGVPLMLEGLEYLKTLEQGSARKRNAISPKGAYRKGRSALQSVYGDQAKKLLQRLDALHPGLARRVCVEAYGQILSRTGLSFRERELINVTVLFVQQYHEQLYSHLRGATRAGVDLRTLETLIRLLARFTRRPFATTLAMLKTIERPDRT